MPGNFSFLIDNVLAGSALPGIWCSLMEDLQQLREEGITAVVTLTEQPLPQSTIKEAGLEYLHLPVDDFTAPSQKQIWKFVKFVDRIREEGGAVLVHCRGGIGRTGTMLAAYLVSTGLSASEAIEEVRIRRPGSLEMVTQEQAVHSFERALRKARR